MFGCGGEGAGEGGREGGGGGVWVGAGDRLAARVEVAEAELIGRREVVGGVVG